VALGSHRTSISPLPRTGLVCGGSDTPSQLKTPPLSPKGVRWLDCCSGCSSAESGTVPPQRSCLATRLWLRETRSEVLGSLKLAYRAKHNCRRSADPITR
jgi:hypothetical protein